MKICIISFTSNGVDLSIKIKELADREQEVTLYTKASVIKQKVTSNLYKVEEGLSDWTKEHFQKKEALVFIGASGIAVRAISPYVNDKLSDPAVLVIDEGGSFVIPILSGHYGGANGLARNLADKLNATAVITTATDVNRLFAVDVFAKKNDLHICNRDGIEKISSAVLNKNKVTIAICGEVKGVIPKELTLIDYPVSKASVIVSPFKEDNQKADLQLCPKAYVIGIGCRRNKSCAELETAVKRQIDRIGIRRESIMAFASIDRKKDEDGIVSLASHYNLPFLTFTEDTLKEIPGEFNSSAFVEEQVGVDNVCERSALAACGDNGKLILEKQAENGITVAIAERKWSVTFDEA